MSKILTEMELFVHLKEQIYFLQSSAKNYDNGQTIEAKRMATNIRVLVYDTDDNDDNGGNKKQNKNSNKRNKSLLPHNLIKRIIFYHNNVLL